MSMSLPLRENHPGSIPWPAWLSYEDLLDTVAEEREGEGADDLDTASATLLLETAEECLPLLIDKVEANGNRLPSLKRVKHIRFLRKGLELLPAGFATLDASRPWVVYWCLMGLSLLGVEVSEYRERVITTLRPLQNKTGGFGGGNGQYSHLSTTYASLLSLAIVGGEDALDLVDREAMWKWLGRLKQPEGNFRMSEDGERDMRAPYCAATVISILDLPLTLDRSSPARLKGIESFTDNLAEWIGSCQTFEGGISSIPGGEAHGSYVFLALACLCILGEPKKMINRYLNVQAVVKWLCERQHAPEGGLAGRANKVVDGCYSHWLGGCWSLVEAALMEQNGQESPESGLFNREGLIRYILCCCQGDRGGLRDKPSKSVDSYHSCYNLAGLSSAQNYYYYESPDESSSPFLSSSSSSCFSSSSSSSSLTAAFQWRGTALQTQNQVFSEVDRVNLLHPVYVIPDGAAERARAHFASKPKLFHQT